MANHLNKFMPNLVESYIPQKAFMISCQTKIINFDMEWSTTNGILENYKTIPKH